MVTFTRLPDGAWGLRGTKRDGMAAGAVVDVHKFDGTLVPMTVGEIITEWSDGAVLAKVGASGDRAPRKTSASRKAPRKASKAGAVL